ncbi:MAG: response regulator transcription factor [Dehalococcoidales bacterium]|nr:response regulator transcription factor [Dehalococcoidales bacterium]
MKSYRILVLARESEAIRKLTNTLVRKGYLSYIVSDEEHLSENEPIDLLLIEVEYETVDLDMIKRIKQDREIKTLILASKNVLQDLDSDSDIDDFIVKPYDLSELLVRVNRLLRKNKPKERPEDYLKAGDIVIDLPRCEVSVAGRVVDLTFTEYELLKLLISEKGHVLTREVLLNKIWGYDYFGGDRTVDVHITRLRSKIEDPTHNFIETVRNIGYRIKADDR